MYPKQVFIIQKKSKASDDIGGFTESWKDFKTVSGYIDLITGTDHSTVQNAIVEESTHILIIPEFKSGITDAMRVIDYMGRYYEITYADDPMGIHHHNELYLSLGGIVNASKV